MILVLNSDGGSNCVSENLKNRILIFWENRKPLRRKASKMKISELKPPDRKFRNLGFCLNSFSFCFQKFWLLIFELAVLSKIPFGNKGLYLEKA